MTSKTEKLHRVNYRKIWVDNHGPIPKDELGRSYHIHHRDGDRNNNELGNLQCVSLQEHYEIHLAQGDWEAATRLAVLLGLTGEEISALYSAGNRKRIADGTHHFLGGENNRRRIANGTHNLLGDRNPVHQRIADGTHHFLGGEITRESNKKRIADGTHNLLGGENNRRRIANGTHNFTQEHTCPHCGKTGKGAVMFRYHFNNCKLA